MSINREKKLKEILQTTENEDEINKLKNILQTTENEESGNLINNNNLTNILQTTTEESGNLINNNNPSKLSQTTEEEINKLKNILQTEESNNLLNNNYLSKLLQTTETEDNASNIESKDIPLNLSKLLQTTETEDNLSQTTELTDKLKNTLLKSSKELLNIKDNFKNYSNTYDLNSTLIKTLQPSLLSLSKFTTNDKILIKEIEKLKLMIKDLAIYKKPIENDSTKSLSIVPTSIEGGLSENSSTVKMVHVDLNNVSHIPNTINVEDFSITSSDIPKSFIGGLSETSKSSETSNIIDSPKETETLFQKLKNVINNF